MICMIDVKVVTTKEMALIRQMIVLLAIGSLDKSPKEKLNLIINSCK